MNLNSVKSCQSKSNQRPHTYTYQRTREEYYAIAAASHPDSARPRLACTTRAKPNSGHLGWAIV